jgi:hypothetical protein
VLDSCPIKLASTVELMPRLIIPLANGCPIESASALDALHTAPGSDRLFERENARDLSDETRRRRSRLLASSGNVVFVPILLILPLGLFSWRRR